MSLYKVEQKKQMDLWYLVQTLIFSPYFLRFVAPTQNLTATFIDYMNIKLLLFLSALNTELFFICTNITRLIHLEADMLKLLKSSDGSW